MATLVAPVALFLVLAVAFTWPLGMSFGSALAAGKNPSDALLHVHRLWFVPRMLAAGQNPYAWTNLLLYPEGTSQYLETLIPIAGLLGWPALAIGGSIVGFNVVTLLLLTLNGLSAWLLVRDRTRDRYAATVAGIAYAFSPYLLAHLRSGHLNLVTAFWPPMFLLCFLRALQGGEHRWRWALAAGVCLSGSCYTDLQWTLGLAIVVVALLAWRLLRGNADERVSALKQGGLAIGVAILLSLPLLLGIWRDSQAEGVAPGANQARRNSASLFAFLAPQPAQPLWRTAVGEWYAENGLDEGDEQTVALGYVALALAAAGLVTASTRRWGWLCGMLLFAALALGPELHLIGRERVTDLPLNLPMPYALLEQVPLVGLGRAPARFAAPATLCLAVLAAYGVVAIRRRLERFPSASERAPRIAGAACAALLAFELFSAPFPLAWPSTPPIYQALAARGCHGPLLELPVEPDSAREKERLYFQVSHGCPISGGYVSRNQDETELQRSWQAALESGSAESAASLRESPEMADFADIVLWREAYRDEEELRREEQLLRDLLVRPPWYEGEDGVIFSLR